MALPIVNHHLAEIERRQALEASGIYAELVRIRAALVVGIDAADRAEMMFSRSSVEAVCGEFVFALMYLESLMGRGDRHRPAHPANAAGATTRRRQTEWQFGSELDSAAMTLAA